MRAGSGGRASPAAVSRQRLATVLAVASLSAFGFSAKAQVLEIGAAGGVVVHDGPAVFDGSGSAPIVVPQFHLSQRGGASPAMIAEAAQASGVSGDLIAAVAWSESRMRAGALSRAGARGEMQLMPGTARALGVDAADSRQNYQGGATYMHRLLIRYDGDLVRALAAYNAGPGAVDRFGGVPPYAETRAYVAAVLDRLSRTAETAKTP